MKKKHIQLVVILFTLFVYSACKKDKTATPIIEDPHNHSLLTKNLDQIKLEISGRWQMQRYLYSVCGIAGCNTVDFTYPLNKGDYIIFGTNDTLTKAKYDFSTYYIYEKSLVERVKNIDPLIKIDSIYHYSLQNGFVNWVMKEIKNDTLIVDAGPYIYYSIRK